MAKSKPTKMLAVLGRCRRTGRWRLASKSSVLAVLGTCHLDMRDSFVDDEQLKMQVTVFLGTATFIVPNGAEVRPSGMSLLGASTVEVPEHADTSELPTLEIEWTSIFGRLKIISEDMVDGDQAPPALAAPAAQPQPAIAAAAGAPVVAALPSGPTAEAAPAPEPEPSAVAAAPTTPVSAAPGDETTEPSPPAAAAAEVAPAAEAEADPAPVGFEDLDEDPAPVGFEDLDEDPAPAAEPEPEPVAVGFEDLD